MEASSAHMQPVPSCTCCEVPMAQQQRGSPLDGKGWDPREPVQCCRAFVTPLKPNPREAQPDAHPAGGCLCLDPVG